MVLGNDGKMWSDHADVFDEVYLMGDNPVVDLDGQRFRLSHLPVIEVSDGRDHFDEFRPDAGLPVICGHVHDRWRIWHNPIYGLTSFLNFPSGSGSYMDSPSVDIYVPGLWQFNCGVDVNDFKLVDGATVAGLCESRFVKE